MVAASACILEIGNRCELDSPEKYRKDRPRENVIHEDSAEFGCCLLSLSQGEHQLMLGAPSTMTGSYPASSASMTPLPNNDE